MKRFAFLRLGDWFIKHASVIASALIVMLSERTLYAPELLATMVFSVAFFAYTFGLNYYVERDVDSLVGKNRVAGVGRIEATVLFGFLTAVMIGVPLAAGNHAALAIAVFSWLMSTCYSVKPFYWKARPVISVVSQAVFLAVPQLWFFVVLAHLGGLTRILYLSVWLFLLTAKGATIHQILDYANDRDTNLQTFAVRYGMQAAVVLTDAVVFALFALALAGLACFDYPLNAIVFLLVAFSNPRYRRAQTQR